jgi:AraC-like DNA-binding protein
VDLEVLRTRNLDEAMSAVGRVYCPHTVVPQGPVRDIEATLEVVQVCRQPVVNLRYATPVKVDAGNFPDLLLMMSAASGAASAVQGRQSSMWRSGQTMPLSPGLDTTLFFDREFAQSSLRVEIARLESMCARWLGYPLDAPLRFALRPLSPAFEKVWQDAMRVTVSLGSAGAQIPQAASDSLDEFLLSLLLHGHTHNFSKALVRPVEAAAPRLVRIAEDIFRDRVATGTTVSAVAKELGVSLRSLQLGFREARNTTPSSFLRKLRLDAARTALDAGTAFTSVTDVALATGFSHVGRFSAAYKTAFGESPVMTLRRARQRH